MAFVTALEFLTASAHNARMIDKKPKRPADLNQWAKRMLDIATGEASDAPREADRRLPSTPPKTKSRASTRQDLQRKRELNDAPPIMARYLIA